MDLCLLHMLLLTLASGWSAQAGHSAPSYFKGRQLTLSQAPCIDAQGQKGTCMFRFDCIRENGYPMTTCKDKFLFGVCCQLPSTSSSAATPPITHPDQSTFLHFEPTKSHYESTHTYPHFEDTYTYPYSPGSTSILSNPSSPEVDLDKVENISSTEEDLTSFPVLISDQHGGGISSTQPINQQVTSNQESNNNRWPSWNQESNNSRWPSWNQESTQQGITVQNYDTGQTEQQEASTTFITGFGQNSGQAEVGSSSTANVDIGATLPVNGHWGTSSHHGSTTVQYGPNTGNTGQAETVPLPLGGSTVQGVGSAQPAGSDGIGEVSLEDNNDMISLTHFLLQNASLDDLNGLDTAHPWTGEEEEEPEASITTPEPDVQSLGESYVQPLGESDDHLDTLIALLHPGNSINVTSGGGTSGTGSWDHVTLGSSVVPTSVQISSTVTPPRTTTEAATTTTVRPVWDYRKSCGVRPLRPTGRVVGGRNAYFGEWPWQVLVKEATWLGLFVKNKCGGVLISSKFVLTAAHCQPGFLASLLVILGEYDLTGDFENLKPITKNVKRMIVHRDYNPQTFENDIALLELDSVVPPQPHIVPICLPKAQEDFAGKRAYVSGWGKLTHGGSLPSVLQAVRVPIARNSECQQMFLSAGHIKAIRDTFICAGYSNGGRDSCEGDSGGPLMIQRRDHRWVLVGTVSHGIGCADPNLPGVYMRTTSYLKWLTSIVGPATVT